MIARDKGIEFCMQFYKSELLSTMGRISLLLCICWAHKADGRRPHQESQEIALQKFGALLLATTPKLAPLSVTSTRNRFSSSPRLARPLPSAKMNIENTNAEIKSCAEFGDQDKAAGLLSEALQAGLQPDLITYNGVMEACANSNDAPKAAEVALSLLGEMPANRVRPDAQTLTLVMNALIKASQFKSGFTLLDEIDKGSFAYMQREAYPVYAALRDTLKSDELWDTKFDADGSGEAKSGWKLHIDIQERMNVIGLRPGGWEDPALAAKAPNPNLAKRRNRPSR